jgi:streptogrisin C
VVSAATVLLVAAAVVTPARAADRSPVVQPSPAQVRDLGEARLEHVRAEHDLSAREARRRVAAEDRAIATATTLTDRLGARVLATEFTDEGVLEVRVADSGAAAVVAAAGAVPVVDTTAGDLQAARSAAQQAAADLVADGALEEPVTIEIDHAADSLTLVVPEAVPDGTVDALASATRLAAPDDVSIDVESTPLAPELSSAPLKGGDRISSTQRNGLKVDCTVSFMTRNASGQRFALTAGHCDNAIELKPFYFAGGGGPYDWYDGSVLIGKRTVAIFGNYNRNPDGSYIYNSDGTVTRRTDDYALIKVNDLNRTQPRAVVRTAGADLPVAGSENAVTGTTLCKYGQVTGAGCGKVKALNVTMVWPWGSSMWVAVSVTVDNLINVGVCTRSGDSGGPLFRVSNGKAYAVGILDGGSQGPCPTSSTEIAKRDSYYQPVREVLQKEGLTLLTS